MIMFSTIILILSVFLAVYFGFVNFAKLIHNQNIYWPNILLMTIGLTSIIAHYMGVY